MELASADKRDSQLKKPLNQNNLASRQKIKIRRLKINQPKSIACARAPAETDGKVLKSG
jgi:hypothetical protein